MYRQLNQKRITLQILCLAIFFTAQYPSRLFAQTANEIIGKHLKAIGGRQKIDAVNSYSFQIDSRIIYYKKPGKWRVDHSKDGKIIQTQIFHGDKGWTIYKSGEAEGSISGMEFENFLTGLLVYAKAPDYKVAYLGPDSESDNLLIKITPLRNNSDGHYSYTYYINPATYMITKMRQNLSGTAYMAYFEEYSTINGIQVPIKVSKVNDYSPLKLTEIKTNIKINVVLDDKLFLKPALKKQLLPFTDAAGKYGFRDENEIMVIKPKYDNVWGFTETGLAKVKLNDLVGFINMKGAQVIPLQYSDALGFYGGLSAVQLNKKWGYIDSTGKMVIPAIYDKVVIFRDGWAGVSLGAKWGFVDRNGGIIVPIEYDYLGFWKDGKVSAKKDGVSFSIDKTGKKID
jgi:hypothetical protein